MAEPVLENMTAVRLRGVGYVVNEGMQTIIIAVMDSTDANKVLMFLKVTQNSEETSINRIEAITVRGSEVFFVPELEVTNAAVIQNGRKTGNIHCVQIDESNHPIVFILQPEERQDEMLTINYYNGDRNVRRATFFGYELKNMNNVRVCTVNNSICPATVEVSMNRTLPLEDKFLILACATGWSLHVYGIVSSSLPRITSISSSVHEVDQMRYWVTKGSKIPPSILQNRNVNKFRIRASGFSEKYDEAYYDIIDVPTELVVLTAELSPTLKRNQEIKQSNGKESIMVTHYGRATVRDTGGCIVFTAFGYLNEDMINVYSPGEKLAVFYQCHKFFDRKGKTLDLFFTIDQSEKLNASWNRPTKTLNFYDGHYQKLATVSEEFCTLKIEFFNWIAVDAKMIMFALAFRVNSTIFGLDRLPMPEMRTLYLDNNLPSDSYPIVGSLQ